MEGIVTEYVYMYIMYGLTISACCGDLSSVFLSPLAKPCAAASTTTSLLLSTRNFSFDASRYAGWLLLDAEAA